MYSVYKNQDAEPNHKKLQGGFIGESFVILPPFLLAVQSLNALSGGYLSYVRAAILLIIVLSFYFKHKKKVDSVAFLIFIFLAYTFIISFKSSDLRVTMIGYVSIFVSMSFYTISYNTIRNNDSAKKFRSFLYTIPLVFICNAILYTGFGLGEPVYGPEESFRAGTGIHNNTIYTGVLAVILSFVIFKYSSNKRRDAMLLTAMVIIIIITFRRTCFFLLAISLISFVIMTNNKKALKYVLSGLFLLIVTFPMYQEHLENVIAARGKRAKFAYETVETSSRFAEINVITKKLLHSDDCAYILTGIEYLNSFGTYFTRDFPVPYSRILHTDYSVLLHGSGLIGFLLYFAILIAFLYKTGRYVKLAGKNDDISILLVCLVFVLVLVTFSGSILNITFRTTLFILLGSFMKLADNQIKSKRVSR